LTALCCRASIRFVAVGRIGLPALVPTLVLHFRHLIPVLVAGPRRRSVAAVRGVLSIRRRPAFVVYQPWFCIVVTSSLSSSL
jgi:hypothetical protein